MQQGFGQMGGAMQGAMGQMGFGGAMAGPGGAKPTRRNAIMVLLMPGIFMFAGILVSVICGFIASAAESGIIGLIGSLLALVGFIAGAVVGIKSIINMTNELKSVTQNPAFAWWPIIIPFYNYYWAWVMVPQEMAKAKQMRGIQTPARGFIVYFIVFLYAFASDLNDIAKAP